MADKRNWQAEAWRHKRRKPPSVQPQAQGPAADLHVQELPGVVVARHGASAVPVLGVYATENCLASGGRHCYAFIYVGTEDDGNRFIQAMATTTVDRELLTAEWSSSNKPNMLAILHRLQAAGGTEISYWHPMQGEIPHGTA